MDKAKIDRINTLAKKSKTESLTPEEQAEQKQLRKEYIADFRNQASLSLDSVYIVDEEGNAQKLQKKAADPHGDGTCSCHHHHHEHHHRHEHHGDDHDHAHHDDEHGHHHEHRDNETGHHHHGHKKPQ